MTFNPSVPNAGQSPGLFPVQNSNNMTRLKAMIAADHVFNDTVQSTDGVHNQVTYISKSNGYTPTVGGGDAELYSEIDSLGVPQLNFWNGTTNFILTPSQSPTKVVGSVTLASGATSGVIYTLPTDSSGTIFVGLDDSNRYRYYLIYSASGVNAKGVLLSEGLGPQPFAPTVDVDGATGDITVTNNASDARTLNWYIIVESLP